VRTVVSLLTILLPLGLLAVGVLCLFAAVRRRWIGRPVASALVGAAAALGAAVLVELIGIALVGALID
jgi:hypothetical protein